MDLNHETGDLIEGWPQVVQSIQTLLSTPVSSRVFQREFGSDLPSLVGAPLNDVGILAVYVAVAEAIDRWEPRFELSDVAIEAEATGRLKMTLHGAYRPRAHVGDVSRIDDGTQTIRLVRGRVDQWSLIT